jgi:hypothetical protein
VSINFRKRRRVGAPIFIVALPFLFTFSLAFAASQYTPKQLESFGLYVGKTYWVVGEDDKTPAFLSAPSSSAKSFHPAVKDSFEIKEIVGGTAKIPAHYYRAAFESGKEGFIPISAFMEHYNGAFVAVDPDREAKAKSAKETGAEKNRRAWIDKQKWPEHVKEAARKKQPVLGMNQKEAHAVLGKPKSTVQLKSASALMGGQEQWIYENGPVLTFTNGILTRIQPKE